MRAESQAPRNSRELAVRNQFFTPRYVVQFLTDNTLGRIWYEMRQGDTELRNPDYLVRRPHEVFLSEGEEPPPGTDAGELTQEELLKRPVYVPFRAKKDPRDIRVVDPACGSGHFLLYAFDLLLSIYEECWRDESSPAPEISGGTLHEDYPDFASLQLAVPGLILRHNLHGIDIDVRCAQIAALALWMRAQRAYNDLGIARDARPAIQKTSIVVAEPMPGDRDLRREFVATLEPKLAQLVERVFDRMELAGEAGSLVQIEEDIRDAVQRILGEHGTLFRTSDEERWRRAESELLSALSAYAHHATNGRVFRRRLFVEDAARGLGLIDLCSLRYDVVLMNPPFGEVSNLVGKYIEKYYGQCKKDYFPCFVVRAVDMLSEHGRIGAITNRTGFFLDGLSNWRKALYGKDGQLRLFADLGLGVLDALVETAAYVVEDSRSTGNRDDVCIAISVLDIKAER